jgi:hypothetical protein
MLKLILPILMASLLSASVTFSNSGLYSFEKKDLHTSPVFSFIKETSFIPLEQSICFGTDIISENENSLRVLLKDSANTKLYEEVVKPDNQIIHFTRCISVEDYSNKGRWTLSVESSNKAYDKSFNMVEPVVKQSDVDFFFSSYKKQNKNNFNILLALKEKGELVKFTNISSIGTFYSFVLSDHPDQINTFMELANTFNDEETRVALQSLYFSKIDNKAELIQSLLKPSYKFSNEYFQELKDNAPTANIIDLNVSGAGIIDMFWASYFATGESRYVEKIIEQLPLIDNVKNENEYFIGLSSRWSLLSNSVNNKNVLVILKTYKSSSVKTNEILQELVKSIEKELNI